MPARSLHDARLDAPARAGLSSALRALDAHTDAPVRLRAHAVARGHDVFDVEEEFEIGGAGRRFLVSVSRIAHDAMLLDMGRAA